MRTAPYTLAEKRLMLIGMGQWTASQIEVMDKEEILEVWTKTTRDMEELDVEALEEHIPV